MDLTTLDPDKFDTDITRLRKGGVGGQFWSVYVDAKLPGPEQVEATLEQIGLMQQIYRRYLSVFEPATTAADVRRIEARGKIASLLGVEGGGQIDGKFAVLRAYRRLGASYLTLTHAETIAWGILRPTTRSMTASPSSARRLYTRSTGSACWSICPTSTKRRCATPCASARRR